MINYISYQCTILLKSDNLKIESFLFSFGSSFYITNYLKRKKYILVLFLSLAISGNGIIRYPGSSLKYHLSSFLSVF